MIIGPYELIDMNSDYSYGVSFCKVCDTEADVQSSQKQALVTGLSFAHCGNIIFQVVQCHTPGCHGRFVFRCSVDSPVFDIQDMILMPQRDPFENEKEQRKICIDWERWPNKLKFQYRKGWDEKCVSKQEFLNFVENRNDDSFKSPFKIEQNLYQPEKHFWELLKEEHKKNKFLLKRLYPNNRLYRSLINCVALPPITDSNPENAWPMPPSDDIEDKKTAVLYLMELYAGQDIYPAVESKLKSHGIAISSETLHQEIDKRILTKVTTTINDFDLIHKNILEDNSVAIEAIFKNTFGWILYPVCTEKFLESRRKKLSSWTTKAKQGIALFVDAPMGIGKTYSITEGLASNPDVSAVIFMPTKKLCQDLRYKLAERISFHEKILSNPEDKIPFDIDNNQLEFDENDDIIEQYTEKYYQDRGVYLFDGINENECLHYEAILNRYESGYYRKKDICDKCNKEKECRFLKHKIILNNYRIVITTHYMYDFFFYNASFRKWKKANDNPEIDKGTLRDYFIIDEDFILTNCYQPISLTEEKLINFVVTLTNFFKDPDFNSEKVDKIYFQKTDLVLGLAVKTLESSVIPPIDQNFKYPKSINTVWKQSLKEQENIIPDEVLQASPKKSYPFYVGDYLAILENAIRKGFVVQVNHKTKIKTIFLPNPKEYSFEKRELPAHVFFDGTKLESKYIRKKLKGIQVQNLDIKIDKLLWDIKVYQNINTDLPKNKSEENIPKIKAVISKIVKDHGPYERYFILTKKAMKQEVLSFVSEKFPEYNFVVEYFGNLRGLNSAQRCNVGIILGSLILPDTVEIAMSLDLIQKKMRALPPYPMKIFKNIWTWRGSLGTKQYKEDFLEIEDFSKTYRYSEYRQALARTRYLSHPVTFYVFSKDRLDSYEPFISKIENLEYCNDIFPPRPKHSNNQEKKIKAVVFEWLKTNDFVSATDIYKNYPGMRRQTIGKHLNELKEAGVLKQYKTYKKKYCI